MIAWLILAGCALPPPGVPLGIDDDSDGAVAADDCNDTDPTRLPGKEWPIDLDGDGFRGGAVIACEPPANLLVGESLGDDCDDSNPDRGLLTDWYYDDDRDGYGTDVGAPVSACDPPERHVANNTDCNDFHPRMYPGALEDCGVADLDCGALPDPSCRLSGSHPLPSSNPWEPELAARGPELDGDAKADVILLGDFSLSPGTLVAQWYPLDDDTRVADPIEYTFVSENSGYSLAFKPLPDLDADGVPEVWLAAGDFNNPGSHLWNVADVAPGPLLTADAFAAGDGDFSILGLTVKAGDLRDDAGVEVALTALGYLNGRVEIWGGFSGTPTRRGIVTGPGPGTWFGADLAVGDLDGDGLDDLAITGDQYGAAYEGLYVFHGPFPNDRDIDDADAAYEAAGGLLNTLGTVELAGDLEGTGVPWLWWGAPDDTVGGRVFALPGDYTASGITDPLTVQGRAIRSAEYPGLGGGMAMVGDQTGDGIPDPLVGAPWWSGSSPDGAFILDSNAVAFGGPGERDLAEEGLVLASFHGDINFGFTVSGAGDADPFAGEDVWIGGDGPAFLFSGGVVR